MDLFSFLHTIRTTSKAWMSLNFVKIPSPILDLAPLEHLKIDGKCCDHSSVYIFYWIFFILAGKKVIHNNLDGFEIRPDQTLDFGLAALEHLKKSP